VTAAIEGEQAGVDRERLLVGDEGVGFEPAAADKGGAAVARMRGIWYGRNS
jgi:hypothetical protein